MEVVHGLGLREWVALGVLGFAGLLGFLFFDPTSTDGGTPPPKTISLGTQPTATPFVKATATPVPVIRVTEPRGGWLVVYWEDVASGGEIRTGEGFVDRLALEFPGRPFPDIRDDGWRLEASQELELEPGRYGFTLESDGAVKAWAGDAQLLDEADSSNLRRSELEFDHPGGRLMLRFAIDDTGGPAVIRWVE